MRLLNCSLNCEWKFSSMFSCQMLNLPIIPNIPTEPSLSQQSLMLQWNGLQNFLANFFLSRLSEGEKYSQCSQRNWSRPKQLIISTSIRTFFLITLIRCWSSLDQLSWENIVKPVWGCSFNRQMRKQVKRVTSLMRIRLKFVKQKLFCSSSDALNDFVETSCHQFRSHVREKNTFSNQNT